MGAGSGPPPSPPGPPAYPSTDGSWATRGWVGSAADGADGRGAYLTSGPANRLGGHTECRRGGGPGGGGPAAGPLTPREREVTVLVAQGLTNCEVGARLVVTDRTVATHVGHILAKLGLPSRVQIAAWAAEQGLGQPPP